MDPAGTWNRQLGIWRESLFDRWLLSSTFAERGGSEAAREGAAALAKEEGCRQSHLAASTDGACVDCVAWGLQRPKNIMSGPWRPAHIRGLRMLLWVKLMDEYALHAVVEESMRADEQ